MNLYLENSVLSNGLKLRSQFIVKQLPKSEIVRKEIV